MHKIFSKFKRPDFIMTAILVFIAVLSLLMIIRREGGKGRTVRIISGGKEIAEYDMDSVSDDMYLTVIPATASSDAYIIEGISCPEGHYNVIRISHDGVCVTDSDCPHRFCALRGAADSNDIPIACLPNKLIITIDSADNGETDAWTY